MYLVRLSKGRTSVFTYVISGRQILIFTAGVSFLSVQQQVVDHLLLVLPAERIQGDIESRDQKKRRQADPISFMLPELENTESLPWSSQISYYSWCRP